MTNFFLVDTLFEVFYYLPNLAPHLISGKLMQLGVTNLMVDDSDFKLVDFDCRFRSDSDFNDEIESRIAISI